MGISDFKARIILTASCFIFLLALMAVRFYHVQITRHEELYGKAKREYTDVIREKGKRGEIYDINGSLLAGNAPCSNVIADPQQTGDDEQCAKTAAIIAEILHVDKPLVFSRLTRRLQKNGNPNKYVMIQRKISLDMTERLRSVLKKEKCTGIFFRETFKRYYPKEQLLAQTLGFISMDRDREVGRAGIEAVTNKDISPDDGKIIRERDRKGHTLFYGKKKVDQTEDGKNVFLTIDEQIQTIVEEELEKLCSKFHPKAAYAIMVNPFNGNIMALAQRPTFNPNDRSTMNADAWRNRITMDVFEPGSTMKPIVISSALDYGVVTPNSLFDCEMGYWKDMRLRDSHHMGVETVTRILAESSNVGTAKIAVKMGKIRLYKTFRRFGIGSRTGIPLRESSGILRKPDKWDYLSISRFPIGQGVSVTPLQLVRAYCAIANGGYLVQLRLVDRIQDTATGKFERKSVKIPDKVFMKSETQHQIVDMMKLVTQEGGTATRAALPGYAVAGKTGTSQKWINTDKAKGIKGHYSETRFFATFVGFVPADNPAFVLAVITDEPQGNHYGGVVSAPTFREIARKTLAYLNIPQDQ